MDAAAQVLNLFAFKLIFILSLGDYKSNIVGEVILI